MKLLIEDNRIVAIVTDQHVGGVQLDPPENFDFDKFQQYRLIDQQLVIPAPQTITMHQARSALLTLNLLGKVNSNLATIANEQTLLQWEYATELVRGSPLVELIEIILLTDITIEQLFEAGAIL